MKKIAILTTLVLSLPATSRAFTPLTTGAVQAATFVCSAVNVSASPITNVTIEIVNSGTGAVLGSTSCANVAANVECAWAFGTSTTRAFCRISSSTAKKNLRGTLLSVLGSTTLLQEAR
ncbi:hypothetical protein KGQ64_16390 [bacterium]|nr:hypothetical protein [bacterium]